MTSLTNYAEQKAIEHFFRGVAYSSPDPVYVGIMRASPAEDGTGGNEPVGLSGYSRLALSLGSYSSRQVASSAQLDWLPLVDWGVGLELAVFDSASGGNMLLRDIPLSPQQDLVSGVPFAVAVGNFIIRCLASVDGLSGAMPYLSQRILEHLFKAANHPGFSTRKMHLATTKPTPDGAGAVYLSASDYTPKDVSFGAYDATIQGCPLSANLQFRAATGPAWGAIDGWVLTDGADPLTSNPLYVAPILPKPTVGVNVPFSLLASSTSIRLF